MRLANGKWRMETIRHSYWLFALLLLLAGDRLGRTLARARVGMGTLATHRQSAAMTQAAIAAEIHQTLDVHAGLTPQVTFDHIVAVDHFTNLQHFLIAQLRDPAIIGNLDLLQDVGGIPLADAMDVLERDEHTLVGRDIHAGHTGHGLFSCRRSVPGRQFFRYFGQVSANANTTPFPLDVLGPGIV